MTTIADDNGCTCIEKRPRTALEHDKSCPVRVTFYGAPAKWGVGLFGEERVDHNGQSFVYQGPSWQPVYTVKGAK